MDEDAVVADGADYGVEQLRLRARQAPATLQEGEPQRCGSLLRATTAAHSRECSIAVTPREAS